eukprot:1164817-Prymnesium_polylepis.1
MWHARLLHVACASPSRGMRVSLTWYARLPHVAGASPSCGSAPSGPLLQNRLSRYKNRSAIWPV